MGGKRLYIVRHGKSSWAEDGLDDRDRPLKKLGILRNIEVSNAIIKHGIPDMIISSMAVRALHTAVIMAREMKYPVNKIQIEEKLYYAEMEECLRIIKALDNAIHSLMMVGHNPIFTDMANEFLHKQIIDMPTSGCVLLDFDVTEWKDISRAAVVVEKCIFATKTED